jgi:hypothetical protein
LVLSLSPPQAAWVVRIGALFAHFVPDLITTSPCGSGSGIGRRVRLWQLVRWLPRSAGEQERQRRPIPTSTAQARKADW